VLLIQDKIQTTLFLPQQIYQHPARFKATRVSSLIIQTNLTVNTIYYHQPTTAQWQNSWFHADIGISENEISRIMVFGFFEEQEDGEWFKKCFALFLECFWTRRKLKNPDFQIKTQFSIAENRRFSTILASFEGF
jgi:hypothetical protein